MLAEPRLPQSQGKIERWHQTLKDRILLENHYLPGAIKAAINARVSSIVKRNTEGG